MNLIDAHRNESVRDAPAISPDQNSQSVLSMVEGMANPVLEAVGEAQGIARQKRQDKNRWVPSSRQSLPRSFHRSSGSCSQEETRRACQCGQLTAQPSWKNRTVLKKSDFRDALCKRYGLQQDTSSHYYITQYHSLSTKRIQCIS